MKILTTISLFLTYIILNIQVGIAQSLDSILVYPIKIGCKKKDISKQLKKDTTLRVFSYRKITRYSIKNSTIDSIRIDSIEFDVHNNKLAYIRVYYPCKYKEDINQLIKLNNWESSSDGRYAGSIITKTSSIDKYCIISINTFDSLEYTPCKLTIYNLKDRYTKKEIKKIMNSIK